MSKKMTPCERLGYKVGDEFEVISHHAFKRGQVVTLHEDDGTECPLFAGDGGGAGVFDGVECSFATLNKQVRKIANKLKPAKQALADAIHQNGGWVDGANFSSQDCDGWVYHFKTKPTIDSGSEVWKHGGCIGKGQFKVCKIKNWHQTVLSREEYYQAYPKADADGWIEWNGGECPVDGELTVYVNYRDGGKAPKAVKAGSQRWNHSGLGGDIMSYSLHNKDIKPEFCESVMRSIPEPESIDGLCAKVTEENKHQHVDAKPTIEQLAQDYRNKLDFANRKQDEADKASMDSGAALSQLEDAIAAIGFAITPLAATEKDPELVITDWRDLRVNDVIFVGEYDDCESGEYVVIELEDRDYGGGYAVKAAGIDGNDRWIDTAREWRFIRRP